VCVHGVQRLPLPLTFGKGRVCFKLHCNTRLEPMQRKTYIPFAKTGMTPWPPSCYFLHVLKFDHISSSCIVVSYPSSVATSHAHPWKQCIIRCYCRSVVVAGSCISASSNHSKMSPLYFLCAKNYNLFVFKKVSLLNKLDLISSFNY